MNKNLVPMCRLVCLLILPGLLGGCGDGGKEQVFDPERPSARAVETLNVVEHQKAGEDGWDKTEHGSMMVSRDQVRTGAESKAILLFIDNNRTTLGPESLMVIKKITGKKTEHAVDLFDTVVKVTVGLALFEVKEGEGSRSFVVETPYAVIVHRGTTFLVDVAEDGSARVVVKDGHVEVRALDRQVTVGPSQATIVRKNSPPTEPEIVNLVREPGFSLNRRQLPTLERRSGF